MRAARPWTVPERHRRGVVEALTQIEQGAGVYQAAAAARLQPSDLGLLLERAQPDWSDDARKDHPQR